MGKTWFSVKSLVKQRLLGTGYMVPYGSVLGACGVQLPSEDVVESL